MGYNNLRLEKAKLTEELQQIKISKDYLMLDFTRQKELSEENVTAKNLLKVRSELEASKSKIENIENQIQILQQTLSLSSRGNTALIALVSLISECITAVNEKLVVAFLPMLRCFQSSIIQKCPWICWCMKKTFSK